MRILSYGGGLDSTSILVLIAQGKISPVDSVVFANTGDKSENPKTIEYIDRHIIPYCKQNGIRFDIVQRKNRKGENIDLLDFALEKSNSFPIVQYLENGAPMNRTCTRDWKVRPIDKYLGKGEHTILIGFSFNETYRLKNRENPQIAGKLIKHFEYPLIDLQITKDKSISIIESSGLPIPEKSSCWFCPYGQDTK